MKCTNCANEVAEGAAECPWCNVVVSGSSGFSAPPVPSPAPVAADAERQHFEIIAVPSGRRIPPVLYLVPVCVLAALVWFFLIPVAGLPVPAGAVEDAQSHFAVSPVAPGWIQTSTRQNQGDLLETLAFRKPDGEAPLKASFVVFVRSVPLPDFTAEAKPQLEVTALSAVAMVYPDYQHLTTQGITVDNLKALRLTGFVSRRLAVVAGSSAPPFVGYRTTALLVPGVEKTYLVLATTPDLEARVIQPLMETALESFRVTERPLTQQQAVKAVSSIVAIVSAALLFLLVAYKIVRGIMSR